MSESMRQLRGEQPDSVIHSSDVALYQDATKAERTEAIAAVRALAVERAALIAGSRLDPDVKRGMLARLALLTSDDGVTLAINKRCQSAAAKVTRDARAAFKALADETVKGLSLDTPASPEETMVALGRAVVEDQVIRAAVREARKREKLRIALASKVRQFTH